jgi:arylsulfatase A
MVRHPGGPSWCRRTLMARPTASLHAAQLILLGKIGFLAVNYCAALPLLQTGYHVGHFASNNGGGGMLSNGSTTVASLLREHKNYRTRLIGKWGLDGNYEVPKPPAAAFPTLQGFDGFYGQSDQWQCHDYYPPFMFNDTANLTVPENVGASVAKCGPDHSRCTWSADLWTQDAVDWITASGAATPNRPWFLYQAYTSPHAGSVGSIAENDVPAPRVSTGPYAAMDWPAVEVHFATAVTEIDAAVGRLVDTVDSTGQGKDTIIFFASDNVRMIIHYSSMMMVRSVAYDGGVLRAGRAPRGR